MESKYAKKCAQVCKSAGEKANQTKTLISGVKTSNEPLPPGDRAHFFWFSISLGPILVVVPMWFPMWFPLSCLTDSPHRPEEPPAVWGRPPTLQADYDALVHGAGLLAGPPESPLTVATLPPAAIPWGFSKG